MQSGAIDYFCSQIHQAPLRTEIAYFVFAILNNVLLIQNLETPLETEISTLGITSEKVKFVKLKIELNSA